MQFYFFKNGTKVPLIRHIIPVNESFVLHITSYVQFENQHALEKYKIWITIKQKLQLH